MYYLQHPVNPPVYPVSPVILSKIYFRVEKNSSALSAAFTEEPSRIAWLFFLAGADADGDVGVPVRSAGRVIRTEVGGFLALQSWAIPEDGPLRFRGRRQLL